MGRSARGSRDRCRHSAFSRAAAEVLTGFTGTEFFPGGLGESTISRLYGGIHVRADDLAGRIMGATCGRDAWELAGRYYDGSIGS